MLHIVKYFKYSFNNIYSDFLCPSIRAVITYKRVFFKL